MDFLVKRDDLHEVRIEEGGDAPELSDGEALLEVDCFGMTANNITYAVLGDMMNYWKFFPSGVEGWGRVPVWGFAEVADANGTGLEDGARYYGYLPPSSHLVVRPERVDKRGFNDGAPHRAELPSAYQGYRGVSVDPIYDADKEAEQMLFWPLYYTSFMIDDQLADKDFYGAERIVIASASSKTALIAAYLLAQRDGVEIVGLTSPGNVEFVEGLGVYDATATYDEIEGLPDGKAAYVDMSGDHEVRRAVHERYGNDLTHDMVVGVTHHDKVGDVEGLPGPRPEMFFAPTRITERIADWGAAAVDEKVCGSWKPFVDWSGGWLEVERRSGTEALKETYLEVLDGKVPPRVGRVISLK